MTHPAFPVVRMTQARLEQIPLLIDGFTTPGGAARVRTQTGSWLLVRTLRGISRREWYNVVVLNGDAGEETETEWAAKAFPIPPTPQPYNPTEWEGKSEELHNALLAGQVHFELGVDPLLGMAAVRQTGAFSTSAALWATSRHEIDGSPELLPLLLRAPELYREVHRLQGEVLELHRQLHPTPERPRWDLEP